MLVIQRSNSSGKQCTPNVLPCKINHNGPVNATERYWKPERNDDGTSTSYFRGRKLRGKTVSIPHGYQGVVLQTSITTVDPSKRHGAATDAHQPTRPKEEEEDEVDEDAEDDDEDLEAIKVLQEVACFDEITVWGHEMVLNGAEDPYSKAIEEWSAFAHSIHSYDEPKEDKGARQNG